MCDPPNATRAFGGSLLQKNVPSSDKTVELLNGTILNRIGIISQSQIAELIRKQTKHAVKLEEVELRRVDFQNAIDDLQTVQDVYPDEWEQVLTEDPYLITEYRSCLTIIVKIIIIYTLR